MAAAREAAAADRATLKASMEGDFAAAQAAYAKQMEEQLEAEKEKRVAHLQQQAMRRIANAGIASGFSAWQEQWAEAARQKRMLAAAGARLARPALAAALAGWVGEWRAAEAEKVAAEAARQRGELAGQAAADQAELQQQIAELQEKIVVMGRQHEAALEAAAAERAALQSRMEVDFATAHEAYKQQAAAYAK